MSGEGLEHISGRVEALCHRFDGCIIPAGTPGVPIPKFAPSCAVHPETTESQWPGRLLVIFAAALGSSRGPLLVAQLAAQDFSDIGLRQFRPEFDLPGHLVIRQLLMAVADDLLRGEVRVLLHDEGLDRLARFFIRHADYGGLQHTGMSCQYL